MTNKNKTETTIENNSSVTSVTSDSPKDDPIVSIFNDIERNYKMLQFEMNNYIKCKDQCSNGYNRKVKKQILKMYDMILSCRELSNTIYSEMDRN